MGARVCSGRVRSSLGMRAQAICIASRGRGRRRHCSRVEGEPVRSVRTRAAPAFPPSNAASA
eukprot:3281151-Pleurochrysis_carterae.AAC.1